MENNKTKKAKVIYIIFGIIMFVTLLSALAFMTQYKNVRVNWDASNGITEDASMNDVKQTTLFRLFEYEGKEYEDGFPEALKNENGFDAFAQFVFDYRKSLDNFNDLIMIYAIIGLVAFAIMLIFSNHSRRIYYKSNLIIGVISSLTIMAFGIVLIVQDLQLMATFNSNYDLLNLVSIAQNPLNNEVWRIYTTWDEISKLYTCNDATFIIYIFVFVISIAYSAFLLVYNIKRYKDSKDDRERVLERLSKAPLKENENYTDVEVGA